MAQHYSDPNREDDTYALPDAETFYLEDDNDFRDEDDNPYEAGWYFWFCFPGCMPESDPFGPYDSEEDAIDAMRDMCED